MPVTLLGASEIRALAADLDVTPTKKLGQNFVVDANTVRKIVHVARVTVNGAVAQRLLRDAKEAQREVGRHRADVRADIEIDLHVIALLDLHAVRAKGGRQPQQAQRRRMQIVREPANAIHGCQHATMKTTESVLEHRLRHLI